MSKAMRNVVWLPFNRKNLLVDGLGPIRANIDFTFSCPSIE